MKYKLFKNENKKLPYGTALAVDALLPHREPLGKPLAERRRKMKQYILSDNAVAMIAAIRENFDREKSFLCDVFADVVFQAALRFVPLAAWNTLIAIQEYSHLIDCLSMTDNELKQAEEINNNDK